MSVLARTYRGSLSLLTDLYEITMAYGYWKESRHAQEAVFNLFFRTPPFGGGFTIAAGLAQAVELLDELRFDRGDLDYLGSLTGANGAPLFEPEFLGYLERLEFACDVDIIPEGTVVFPTSRWCASAGRSSRPRSSRRHS